MLTMMHHVANGFLMLFKVALHFYADTLMQIDEPYHSWHLLCLSLLDESEQNDYFDKAGHIYIFFLERGLKIFLV